MAFRHLHFSSAPASQQYLETWSFGHAQRREIHAPGVFHRETFVFVYAQFALL